MGELAAPCYLISYLFIPGYFRAILKNVRPDAMPSKTNPLFPAHNCLLHVGRLAAVALDKFTLGKQAERGFI